MFVCSSSDNTLLDHNAAYWKAHIHVYLRLAANLEIAASARNIGLVSHLRPLRSHIQRQTLSKQIGFTNNCCLHQGVRSKKALEMTVTVESNSEGLGMTANYFRPGDGVLLRQKCVPGDPRPSAPSARLIRFLRAPSSMCFMQSSYW